MSGLHENVSHTLLQGSEKELSSVPSSPAYVELDSAASSSVQLPDVLLPRKPL
jgi:hypothetical protein